MISVINIWYSDNDISFQSISSFYLKEKTEEPPIGLHEREWLPEHDDHDKNDRDENDHHENVHDENDHDSDNQGGHDHIGYDDTLVQGWLTVTDHDYNDIHFVWSRWSLCWWSLYW